MTRHRSSTSKPPRRSSINSSNPNVFSDDYALEEYEPVADGRRRRPQPPAEENPQSAANSPMPLLPTTTTTTTSTPPPPSQPQNLPPRRSPSLQNGLESPYESMRRSRLSQRSINGRDSTISGIDDGQGSRQSVSEWGRTNSTQHRSVRTLSSLGVPRAQSPYRGPTGPSQPYGMFTQDVSLARSPSAATTVSTIRPLERAYSGPAGPTQPYGMYSQNTVPEDEGHEVAGIPSAPGIATFAGIAPATQQTQAIRRLGPDGEDVDDIIGPDGYTEQLPPYSRYANGIPPKIDPVAAANIPPHLNPNYPAQLPPEMSQAAAPATSAAPADAGPSEYYRPEPREIAPASPAGTTDPFTDSSAALSSTIVPSSPTANSEKAMTFRARVKRGGNRRVCCGLLPCWALAFVIVVLVAAILLGGIVGGLVAHHTYSRHPDHYAEAPQPVNNPVTVTTTTLADATPIATPTNLPTLPTGTFSYVLNNPVAGQNLNYCIPAEQRAAWDCPNGANLNLTISMLAPHTPQLSIGFTMPSDPQMPNPPSPQIRYGAQPPILPGPVSMNLMRDKYELGNGPAYFFQQAYSKLVILKGSDMSTGYQGSKRSELEISSAIERRTSSWMFNEFVNVADKPWYCFWNGTFLEGFVYVTQNENSPQASNAAAASSFASPTAPASRHRKARRQAGLTASSNTYPKIIKIEERRPLRNPPQAYCQKMQIMNGGNPQPFQPDGKPIIINLTETEPQPLQQAQYMPPPPPPPPPQTSSSSGAYKKKRAAGGPSSNCMCEWQN